MYFLTTAIFEERIILMFKKQSKLPKSNPKKTKEKLVRAGLLWVSLLFAGFVLFALWQGRGALK